MKCGASTTTITPPVGVDLAGYGARQGPSTSVHDDLRAYGLYLEEGDERLLWLHADLIGFDPAMVADMRSALAAQSGLDARQVLLSATHTHSGPATVFLRHCGAMDVGYMASLAGYLLDAARAALANSQPVTLLFAEGRSTLAQDRRRPSPLSHADPALPVLAFQRKDGSYAGVITNYAMHNTCLPAENRRISGDVAGATARHLLRMLPGQPAVLCTNGGCGNINPPASSTDFGVMEQFGSRLAALAAYALQEQASAYPDAALASASGTVHLPLIILTADEIEAEYERAMKELVPDTPFCENAAAAYDDWRQETLALIESKAAPQTLPMEVQVVRIGPVTFVALAAEVFSRLAVDLRAAAHPHTYVVGYANGDIGYLPPQEIYAEGGYEVDMAYKFYGHFMVAAGSFERARDRGLALMEAL
jgi:neutral ceramidase